MGKYCIPKYKIQEILHIGHVRLVHAELASVGDRYSKTSKLEVSFTAKAGVWGHYRYSLQNSHVLTTHEFTYFGHWAWKNYQTQDGQTEDGVKTYWPLHQ